MKSNKLQLLLNLLISVFLLSACSSSNDMTDPDEMTESNGMTEERDGHSIARLWNEILLEAIRNDFARPTVHARNLFNVSSAMYDAWSVYNSTSTSYLFGQTIGEFTCSASGFNQPNDVLPEQEEAISYAAYRLINHRFKFSPGFDDIMIESDALMAALGYDTAVFSLDYSGGDAAQLGNYIADCYIRFGYQDGSNELQNYSNKFYLPVNPPLRLSTETPGNPTIIDLNRWQPLSIPGNVDQSGNPVDDVLEFLGPEWGQVMPFALEDTDKTTSMRDGFDYPVYFDPGMPPTIDDYLPEEYKWSFSLVAIWSSHMTIDDDVIWDISPNTIGNIIDIPTSFSEHQQFYDRFTGGDTSVGRAVNPSTGMPYDPQMVPRGDYTRVLAEFWADGPESETPPGHWFVIMNSVNDHPQLIKKWQGLGDDIGNLEWDIKSYFTLGGAMHDSAIVAWGVKGRYDYIRPVSAIRAMAELGQSSNEDLPSFHPNGLPLISDYIEIVELGDNLAGTNDEHVGKIKLYSWKGPDYITDPTNDSAGVGWILAENWWPYQRPTFVTPPFAGYVSGHSTYSRAAAEILTAITGDEYFPGGMSEFQISANEFLVFEKGPSIDMTLQWATYRDASDQCSLSRIWGGIHPTIDDLPGRLLGEEVGIRSFLLSQQYFNGTID